MNCSLWRVLIYVAISNINIPAVKYLSYFSSAYALIVTITAIPRFIQFVKATKKRLIENTAIGERFFRDIHFRNQIYLLSGLFINFLYIAIKLFFGIYYDSIWFVALAIYYAPLAIMRFILFQTGKSRTKTNQPIETELKRYRTCGIILLILNQALIGIVILITRQNQSFVYPGILIYVMSAYTFYSITIAIVNIIRFKKHGSPLLSASKAINLVIAMVSILALETAMITTFGNDRNFFKLMTGLTGGAICIIVIVMAIFMILKASKELKKLNINNSET